MGVLCLDFIFLRTHVLSYSLKNLCKIIYPVMINIVVLMLVLSLICCLCYIYWLHHNILPLKKVNKKVQKEVVYEPDDDEISFLKSNYDNQTNNESLFAEETKSTISELN